MASTKGMHNPPKTGASWFYITFPGVTQKNANHRSISLTGTDHSNSRISKNMQF